MTILTQPGRLDQNQDNTYQINEDALDQQYLSDDYQRRERIYELTYKHQIYTISCLEFRKEGASVLILPEFFLLGRPYPTYVYLYAINHYIRNPNTSQRKSAEETKKYFGLTTFAHTTLGRALKCFVKKLPCETQDNTAETMSPAQDSNNTIGAHTQTQDNHSVPQHPRAFPTRDVTRQAREQAAGFFQKNGFPQPETSFVEACHMLIAKHFQIYRRLLL